MYRIPALLFAAVAFLLCPQMANADALSREGDSFEHSLPVDDTELDQVRGKFMNMQGVLINFDLLSRIEMLNMASNLRQAADYQLSSDQIQQAQDNPALIPALVPTIIQNVDSNMLITVTHVLDINVVGSIQKAADTARFVSLDVQAVNALR